MSRIVLDASPLLVLLNRESDSEALTPELLRDAVASTVNLSEVHGKLVSNGVPAADAWEAALSPIREAIPFAPDQAKLAGDLVLQTRSLGLSLGDRACLTLVLTLQAPAYTPDKS